MSQIKCIIVEDEPLAVDVLKNYINQIPHLSLIASLENAFEAIELLRNTQIDLIFLDINLPRLNGFDFLKSIPDPPKIIITTAHHEYAIQGFELRVIDYLLKPIEFSRFLAAINKVEDQQKGKFKNEVSLSNVKNTTNHQRPFKFFHIDRKKVKVFLDEILYIESLKEYVKIVTVSQKLMVNIQIGTITKSLPGNFIRIHRSYVVSLAKVESFNSQVVTISGIDLPIGRMFRDMVIKSLGDLENK